MRLHEIKNIPDENLYENFMSNDVLLEEGAKELLAAGMKKMGAAAAKLKDATDAPAQKAWAEVQSRLATAGKDDAIGKLKAFASKHKVAIGTMAIIGAGLLTATDASAGDAAMQAVQGGDQILNAVAQQVQQAQGGDVAQQFMQAMSNAKVDGMSVQDFASGIEQQAGQAVNKAQGIKIQQDGVAKIIKATLQGGQQVADAAQNTDAASAGRKVNFSQGALDTMRNQVKSTADAMRTGKG